ncbi:hypothetical protein P9112_012165 [Eukaryota sp. TZLM1-RC]
MPLKSTSNLPLSDDLCVDIPDCQPSQQSVRIVSDFFFYLIFLTLFSIAFHLQRPTSEAFFFAEGLKKILVSDDIDFNYHPLPKTFQDLDHTADVWNYIKGVLMNHLLREYDYNSHPLPSDHALIYVLRYNRLLGEIRFRTKRVSRDSCSVPRAFSSMIDHCFDDLNNDNEEVKPYGPNNVWQWQSSRELKGYTFLGHHNRYSGSGYVVDLPLNRTLALDLVDFLKESAFIDLQTRVLFIDFTLYNSALNLFNIVRLTIEMPAGGGTFTMSTFRTIKLFNYLRGEDFVRLFFEILVVISNCVSFILLIKKNFKSKLNQSFLKDFFQRPFWFYLDLTITLSIFLILFLRLYSFLVIRSTRDEVDGYSASSSPVYTSVAFVMNQEQNLLSVIAFLMWYNVFKFLELSNRLSFLTRVLKASAKDIFGFSVIFLILIIGYSFCGRLAFGIDVFEYRSLPHACLALFRMMVGDFNYEDLWNANRVIAPIFLVSFTLLIYFILLNMFLAIINDTFTVIRQKESPTATDPLFSAVDAMTRSFRRRFNPFGRSTKLDLPKVISSPLRRELVDCQQLSHYLASRGELKSLVFGSTPIPTILAYFDSDGDGLLTMDEFNAIKTRIENEKVKQDEINMFKEWQRTQFQKYKVGDGVDARLERIEKMLMNISQHLR